MQTLDFVQLSTNLHQHSLCSEKHLRDKKSRGS